MSTISTKDGTQIHDNDWCNGPVVTSSHGWSPSSDAWDGQKRMGGRNVYQVGSLQLGVLRCGLGLGFLSAVADRFGLWGAFGRPNVEWGNFSRFLDYTHTLNWYLPAGMIPLLGGIATGAEILCGLFSSSAGTHAPPRWQVDFFY